ncbi:hypothetical protein OAK19_03725 [Aureispira]|nr:hypothetical protein [Aureispira sp.]
MARATRRAGRLCGAGVGSSAGSSAATSMTMGGPGGSGSRAPPPLFLGPHRPWASASAG